ncbi:hypothetical protein HanXRQr2_Chr11g0470671 [Helianthus annuus]|uniref:Uncharacterized protein n=1 Tax=Helianthus annuus TaxID=4232 RepID=A0A251T7V9_HELAN|nr:hypothetical protein HanXRQr2_Chr11g0470671 [Helianthus annuus]
MPTRTIIGNILRLMSVDVRMNTEVKALVIHVVVNLYGHPFLHFKYPPGYERIE